MEETLFDFSIITHEKTFYEGKVLLVTVPGKAGYFGILSHHSPIISEIVPGKITIKDSSGKTREIESKGKGFIEVSNNKASLLLDELE